LQPEYLNHAWYLHQRESLFDYLRKFNNESRERNEIKPARYILGDEKLVVKAEIHPALSIYNEQFYSGITATFKARAALAKAASEVKSPILFLIASVRIRRSAKPKLKPRP
jgi:hypothetical protein